MSFYKLTRRRMIGGFAAGAASTLLAGCNSLISGNGDTGPSPLPNPQPTPSGASTPATVTVTATAIATLGPAFAGLSYDKSELCDGLFTTANTNLIGLMQLLGSSILRIGGDSADKIVYIPSGKGFTYPQVAQSDIAALAAFLKASGWRCLYTVNLGGASTGATSPALAAAEVAYVTQQLGASLFGIEIGNEPDAYGNTGSYYAGNWTLSQYETLWNQYRSAILATTPGTFITGPAGGHLSTWTVPFVEDQTKSKLSLLTDHYYRGAGNSSSSTAAELLILDPILASNIQLMQGAQQVTGIPFRIGETNTYTDGGIAGASDGFASAFWALDFLFTCARGGCTGVNFHGGQTASYSPLYDNGTSIISVQPEYYGILLFTLAGQGQLYQTKVSGTTLNVTAYAVQTSTGLNVIVLNKDLTQNLNLTLQLPDPVSYANIIEMTQLSTGASTPSLTATSGVTIQGATVGLNGSFSPNYAYRVASSGSQVTCYVPALSAVIIRTA